MRCTLFQERPPPFRPPLLAYRPFSMHMTPEAARRAAQIAIHRYRRLSIFNPNDPLTLTIHRMLLRKLPDDIAQRRAQALRELSEADIQGRLAKTLPQLVATIALWLRSPSPQFALLADAPAPTPSPPLPESNPTANAAAS